MRFIQDHLHSKDVTGGVVASDIVQNVGNTQQLSSARDVRSWTGTPLLFLSLQLHGADSDQH
jgi:hypothetical protein